MARRASARIRARNSSTPQPQKTTDLYQDGHLRTPKTAPQLASVVETEEMPGAFPNDDSFIETPTKLANYIADAVAGKTCTPKNRAPRPASEEMHPEHYHNSTSEPLDEARWLGISAMGPRTEPTKPGEKWTPAADTPTRNVKHAEDAFEFTFRAQSLELSSEARQLMAEKREEAARIKRDMVRIEEEKADSGGVGARKLARPKGKVGRFSDVHMAEFKKMDSIANHAAASRPSSRDQQQDFSSSSRNRTQDSRPTSRAGLAEEKSKIVYPSLKRTGSKAGLKQGCRADEQSTSSHGQNRTRGTLEESNSRSSPEDGGSPTKRVKLASSTTMVPVSAPSMIKVATPSVMRQSVHAPQPKTGSISYPSLSTPTKSSMARAATVKANKTTMIPALTRTPSKSASKAPPSKVHAGNSLLARSPTKFAHMSAKKEAPRDNQGSPLLARSPTKSIFADRLGVTSANESDSASDKTPLLSRSPARMPKDTPSSAADDEPANKIPLLARTPAKPSSDSNPFSALPTSTGPKSNLMDRFKLLRKSPIKSILRTPQRLYSADPNKIAAGTHLATPPAVNVHHFTDLPNTPVHATQRNKVSFARPPATAPVTKHVDFTASTKSDDESPLPSSKNIIYPSLPPRDKSNERKRRQTLGPLTAQDFTFRADLGHGITFGPSPAAHKHSPRPSIRHVSAEPALPSPGTALGGIERKRKFAYEEEEEEGDDVFAPAEDAVMADDDDGGSNSSSSGSHASASDKENNATYANIKANMTKPGNGKGKNTLRGEPHVDANARPAKRVRTDAKESAYPVLPVAQPVKGVVDRTPIWAKGTAAQKARASLAVEKKKNNNNGGGGGATAVRGRAGAPKKPFGHPAAAAAAGGMAEGEPKAKEGTPTAGEAGGELKKGFLSRARLEALSQPKRR